uniref:Uncharacterized protein n=1 Tax=Timema bartmani TaxID=61472 RepID=A0A7R9I2P4_9NEOP|nr:unnamed protein product [Timema bartmani]
MGNDTRFVSQRDRQAGADTPDEDQLKSEQSQDATNSVLGSSSNEVVLTPVSTQATPKSFNRMAYSLRNIIENMGNQSKGRGSNIGKEFGRVFWLLMNGEEWAEGVEEECLFCCTLWRGIALPLSGLARDLPMPEKPITLVRPLMFNGAYFEAVSLMSQDSSLTSDVFEAAEVQGGESTTISSPISSAVDLRAELRKRDSREGPSPTHRNDNNNNNTADAFTLTSPDMCQLRGVVRRVGGPTNCHCRHKPIQQSCPYRRPPEARASAQQRKPVFREYHRMHVRSAPERRHNTRRRPWPDFLKSFHQNKRKGHKKLKVSNPNSSDVYKFTVQHQNDTCCPPKVRDELSIHQDKQHHAKDKDQLLRCDCGMNEPHVCECGDQHNGSPHLGPDNRFMRGYYCTTDRPPHIVTEKFIEDTDAYVTRFWAEVFGTLHIALAFVIAFILQLFRFLLYSLIRSLVVGLIQLTSDYFFKPILTILFNGIIQPVFILLYNMATSFRDLCEPIAHAVGFFFREMAHPVRALRLVEINKNYCGPIVDRGTGCQC